MGNLGVPEGLTRLSLSHHEPLALPGAPQGRVGHGAVPAAARAPTAATTRLSASQVAAPCREMNKKNPFGLNQKLKAKISSSFHSPLQLSAPLEPPALRQPLLLGFLEGILFVLKPRVSPHADGESGTKTSGLGALSAPGAPPGWAEPQNSLGFPSWHRVKAGQKP